MEQKNILISKISDLKKTLANARTFTWISIFSEILVSFVGLFLMLFSFISGYFFLAFIGIVLILLSITFYVFKLVYQFRVHNKLSELEVYKLQKNISSEKDAFLVIAIVNIFFGFVASVVFLVFASKLDKKVKELEFELSQISDEMSLPVK